MCGDAGWIFSDRGDPGELAFPGLSMVGMGESQAERGGKVENERRSIILDAKGFAGIVCNHWRVESHLH